MLFKVSYIKNSQYLVLPHPTSVQVLCPCVEKSKTRDESSLGTEADSDVNVLGLTAQDLRDPGAIVSSCYTTVLTHNSILLNKRSVLKPSELSTEAVF